MFTTTGYFGRLVEQFMKNYGKMIKFEVCTTSRFGRFVNLSHDTVVVLINHQTSIEL